ncbi:hypothetical protein [Roseomonas sp. BN140053]|uniref:hypothetical protein n=1 Tax=Roseomonas sp. BN140053 TaxID=3391898 RepID=UPI0039EAC3E9
MAGALTALMRLHEQLRAELSERLAEIDGREAELRRQLAECAAARQVAERELAALKEAEDIYQRAFVPEQQKSDLELELEALIGVPIHLPGSQPSAPPPPPPPPPPLPPSAPVDLPASTKPARARIGPQRFWMFQALALSGGMSLAELVVATRYSKRTIRKQMLADVKIGMVSGTIDHFVLTAAGLDLLGRFKAYKQMVGEALPSRASDSEDSNPEDRDARDNIPEDDGNPEDDGIPEDAATEGDGNTQEREEGAVDQ